MALLEDTVSVVTGGSSGIGRGIALEFASRGADVVVADIQAEPKEGGAPTHEKIEDETDRRAAFLECDVSQVGDLEAAMDVASELGGVDAMVNNAGIWRPEEFLEMSESAYDQLMDINLKGVYFGSQVAARRMVEAGDGGCIINLSSINGIYGNGGHPTYAASKAGVRVLTYSLAHGLGEEDIRVNAIHPGAIDTAIGPEEFEQSDEQQAQLEAMIPLGRQGQPEDVARAAVFLASDLAAYVSGASLLVDGGWTSWR